MDCAAGGPRGTPLGAGTRARELAFPHRAPNIEWNPLLWPFVPFPPLLALPPVLLPSVGAVAFPSVVLSTAAVSAAVCLQLTPCSSSNRMLLFSLLQPHTSGAWLSAEHCTWNSHASEPL